MNKTQRPSSPTPSQARSNETSAQSRRSVGRMVRLPMHNFTVPVSTNGKPIGTLSIQCEATYQFRAAS